MLSLSKITCLVLLIANLFNLCKSAEVENRKICELAINQELPETMKFFKQLKNQNESGDHISYEGRICNNSTLVNVEIEEKKIKRILVIDPKFCNDTICIGDTYSSTIKKKPNSTTFLSGEEGGILSVKEKSGINYIFDTGNIKIKCYLEPEPCKKEIDNSQIISISI